eukprot:g19492.t1
MNFLTAKGLDVKPSPLKAYRSPAQQRKRSGKGVDSANKTTRKRLQTSNACARSLASRADERDNRDTIAVNIQQKTIQSERKQGEFLTELEKTHLRIRMNHEVGKFEIFYKRLFRASPAWQTRPLNSNQVKSLVGKIKENLFENLRPAYLYPVMLTAKGKQSIGLIDEEKFVQPFWNDLLNYTQFSTIQQFQEATAGLIPERKVAENTQLAWPTDEVKRTYSNAKHQDVYYLVLGGSHGIAALKEALATDPKLAHPLLCFKSCLVYVNLIKLDAHAMGSISQKRAMHHWKEDDFAKVLKLCSELLDLVPKDEAPDDRDVYLRSLVGNNTIYGRANMLNEEKRWNILLIARVVTRAWPGEEAFKAAAKDSQADPELYTLVNNLRNSYALLRTATFPSNLWDMLEEVNKSVEDEWIKKTAQYKAFKSKKNPGLGKEELVRETTEFSEYANPLNRPILAAMQEGVSYELLHEWIVSSRCMGVASSLNFSSPWWSR